MKDLNAWINYLNNLHVRSIDLELGRMQVVANALNITQPSCPVVTVAGTNGKGSVVGFLEALYVKAGYNVAAYTSPYLISFNEQFRLNTIWISDEKLCEYFEIIDKARKNITLTLFEFKTLAALLYFADNKVDLMILEVGLGGRLDSVNLIDPDIAVITSISLDHCDWLGNTRELIAREKAGIFRANKPVVCGDLNPPESIAEVAKEIGAKVFYRNKDFFISENPDGTWDWQSEDFLLKNLPKPHLLKDNIATALEVFSLLSSQRRLGSSLLNRQELRLDPSLRWDDMSISDETIRETIATASVPGRQQIISQDPFIVVDVSHNEDSVKRLVEFLDAHQQKKVTAVFSVLKTKDFDAMARIIHSHIDVWHIAELDTPMAMPIDQIQKTLEKLNIKNIVMHSSIRAAYLAVQQSLPQAIVVFGSFYVAGELLSQPIKMQ